MISRPRPRSRPISIPQAAYPSLWRERFDLASSDDDKAKNGRRLMKRVPCRRSSMHMSSMSDMARTFELLILLSCQPLLKFYTIDFLFLILTTQRCERFALQPNATFRAPEPR